MIPAADDVLIIGGGPVGLAGALALCERGLRVRVVDARRPPIDKACGEGLMPDAVRWLESHGVSLPADACRPFVGIRYLDGEREASARFSEGTGLGVRRTELHRALVERAELAGARLEWNVRAQCLSADGVETSQGERRARWLIGADGLGSNMRRWAGLEARGVRPQRLRRTGIRRHYRIEPWTDHVEVYWADSSEAYVTPVSPRETGIAILQTGRAYGFDTAIESFPRITDRIRGAETTSIDRGGGPLWRRARAVHTDRVALLGDAAGYLDAVTGEGLALGFHEADAVAEAIVAGDLRLYGRSFRKLSVLPFALIRVLLFAERHAFVRRRLIGALAAEPEVFVRLLAIHARHLPPSGLGLGGAARLVRGLCTTGALET